MDLLRTVPGRDLEDGEAGVSGNCQVCNQAERRDAGMRPFQMPDATAGSGR